MFDAGVVGIRRGDRRLTGQLGRIPLRVGDSLLLAAGPDFLQHRNLDRNFHPQRLGSAPQTRAHAKRRRTVGLRARDPGRRPGLAAPVRRPARAARRLLGSGLLTLGELRRRFPSNCWW